MAPPPIIILANADARGAERQIAPGRWQNQEQRSWREGSFGHRPRSRAEHRHRDAQPVWRRRRDEHFTCADAPEALSHQRDAIVGWSGVTIEPRGKTRRGWRSLRIRALFPGSSLIVRLHNHHPHAGGPRLAAPCTLITFRERDTVTAEVVTAREDSKYRRGVEHGGLGVAGPMMVGGPSDPVPSRTDGSGAAERGVSDRTPNPSAAPTVIHRRPGWREE